VTDRNDRGHGWALKDVLTHMPEVIQVTNMLSVIQVPQITKLTHATQISSLLCHEEPSSTKIFGFHG